MSIKDITTDELWVEIERCLAAERACEQIEPATTLIKPVRVVTLVQHETQLAEHASPCPPGSVPLRRGAGGGCCDELLAEVDARLEAHHRRGEERERKRQADVLARVDERVASVIDALGRRDHEPAPRPRETRQRLESLVRELRTRIDGAPPRSRAAEPASAEPSAALEVRAAREERLEGALRSVQAELATLRELVLHAPERSERPKTTSDASSSRVEVATSATVTERRVDRDPARLLAGLPLLWSLLALLLAAASFFTCGVLVRASFGAAPPAISPAASDAKRPKSSSAGSSGAPSSPAPTPPSARERPVPAAGEQPALQDSDGDGLFDPGQPGLTDATTDQCPRAPGPIARQGCPSLDGDHDGVLDRDDACPTIAETDNGYQDDDGCPDELPASVQEFSGVIRGINFDVDGATLRPGAAKTLNRAAEVLDAHPGLRVEISGHTDSTGARRHNLELSQARAETVRAYLIERGIDGDRLETAGFGPDRPLADNATREGRLQNRRIEFRILSERAAGPVSTRP